MNNINNDSIYVVAQAFYGNRTETEIKRKNIDRFILGYLEDIKHDKKINKTFIKVPKADNLVFVYNKYQEDEKIKMKKELFEIDNIELKPTLIIPECDIILYSRCIVCRIDEDGELCSIEDEDFEKFMEYLVL